MRLSDYVEGVLSELGRNDGMVHVYVGLHSDVLGRDIAIGEVLGEADRIFPNYTAVPAFGRYEGQSESSVILQLVNCCKGLKPWEEYVSGVFRLAGALGLLLGQYVVLMVVYPPRSMVRDNFPEYYMIETDFSVSPPVQHLLQADEARSPYQARFAR